MVINLCKTCLDCRRLVILHVKGCGFREDDAASELLKNANNIVHKEL